MTDLIIAVSSSLAPKIAGCISQIRQDTTWKEISSQNIVAIYSLNCKCLTRFVVQLLIKPYFEFKSLWALREQMCRPTAGSVHLQLKALASRGSHHTSPGSCSQGSNRITTVKTSPLVLLLKKLVRLNIVWRFLVTKSSNTLFCSSGLRELKFWMVFDNKFAYDTKRLIWGQSKYLWDLYDKCFLSTNVH